MAQVLFFNYKNFASGSNGGLVTGNAQAKLHAVTVNNPGTTATITVYDNTAGSGTVIASIGAPVAQSYFYDIIVKTGIFVVLAGGTQADVTISFE